jgi:copper resistance protein C
VRITPWLRAGLLGGALVAVVLGPASPAWAHSQLVSMSPADGSTVSVAPTQVVLTFNENIQDIGDAVVVTGPDGKRVDDGPPVILDADATERVHPLTFRGHYTVSYRVVSADGHPVTRTLGFDLSTGAQPPPPSPSTSPSTVTATATATHGAVAGRSSGPGMVALLIGIVAAVFVGSRIRLWRRAR